MDKTIKYGLKPEIITAMQSTFKKHPHVEQAILYGSRAKGNYKVGSDIDLTLKGNQLEYVELLKIENELDDLLLPYKIDLSLFSKMTEPELVEHIERVGIIFYSRELR